MLLHGSALLKKRLDTFFIKIDWYQVFLISTFRNHHLQASLKFLGYLF